MSFLSIGKIRRAFFFLREYFFPSGCVLCGAGLTGMEETWYGLCESCRGIIDREYSGKEAEDRCDLCGRPLISEQSRCLSCRNGEKRAIDRVIALFPYTGKYRRLLGGYKFDKKIALGHFFEEKIRETLERLPCADNTVSPPETGIVPVPPRPGKIQKAGWDQVEYLARLLEREPERPGKWPIRRCLKRLSSNVQKKLGREDRKKNLRGRIVLKHGAPKTAILLDDVITTGSTLDVCAETLKAGGAETVYGVCLFYD